MRNLFYIFLMLILMACSQDNRGLFNGYIDTNLVYLSADLNGRLAEIAVTKGQAVTKTEFLFKLEQESELYRVRMSQLSDKELNSQREQLLAKINYSEINYRRTLAMRKQNAASQGDLDLAHKDLDVLKQQLAELDVKIKNNQVNTADREWNVGRKENKSPAAGIVFDTYYKVGEFVSAGSPILSLITKEHIKVVFFISEQDLSRIRLNEKVKIMSDDKPIATGYIAYISNIAEYTPPIIYSREDRQRLVFRVEAKILEPDLDKIHLGQPVTLELIP